MFIKSSPTKQYIKLWRGFLVNQFASLLSCMCVFCEYACVCCVVCVCLRECVYMYVCEHARTAREYAKMWKMMLQRQKMSHYHCHVAKTFIMLKEFFFLIAKKGNSGAQCLLLPKKDWKNTFRINHPCKPSTKMKKVDWRSKFLDFSFFPW